MTNADWITGWQTFLDACGGGDAPELQRFLSAGWNPGCRDVLSGYTCLHLAATAGHLEVVRLLVEAGADIHDRRNTVESTPLAGAVVAGRTDVVAYPLMAGADPHERLYGDRSSLADEARRLGDDVIVALLTEAAARIGPGR